MNTLLIRMSAMAVAMAGFVFPASADVESVTISPVSQKLAVGGSRTYKAVILPESESSASVSWDSSNPEVATIDANGKVRGMAPGQTYISATCGAKSDRLLLTVSLKDAKTGYYLFSDGTWEQSAIVAGKKCVGMIYQVNADGRSGRAVSLDEAEQLKWSLALAPDANATETFDGMANLQRIMATENWTENFDAEAWCFAKSEGDIQWYLPAVDELRQLFAATCGLVWVESGADPSNNEVDNWSGNSVTMVYKDGQPDIDPYPEARATFNANLQKAGGTPISADKYWSSTQMGNDMATFLSFEGGYSNGQPKQYFHVCRTRAITRFKEPDAITVGVNTVNADFKGRISVGREDGIVRVNAAESIAGVSIYSMSGIMTTVPVHVGSHTAEADVSSLPSGVYILRVATENGTQTLKIQL